MARIRTVKPEFPHSESMGAVSRDARLLFIMLWTLTDDYGRLRGDSRLLASLLYPYDPDARELLPVWMGELEREDCVMPYEVDGHSYVLIKNWASHQKIDKPSGAKFPAPLESSRILANPLEVSCEEGKGREGKGVDQGREGKGVDRGLPIGIPPQLFEVSVKMKELGFLDPDFEATKFIDYWEGRDWHRDGNPMKNWKSSCNNWKTNAVKKLEFPGVAPKRKSTEPVLGVDYLIDEKTGKRIPFVEGYGDED